MATKSPGVYFSEIDNTAYENPKTVTGTTVCVVGYAKKGPIGVPTEITSWSSFKSTFGTPIDGLYSGLAVYNVLSAGGSVMFCRVADDTASQSNYIVKNPIEGSNGSVCFTRSTDIKQGVSNYTNGLVYTVKLSTYDKDSKVMYVRAPASGKLTQSSVLAQLEEQLAETPAAHELKLNSSITGGLYSFNIMNGESKVSTGDFYIEVSSGQSGATLAQNIASALTSGSNAITTMVITRDAAGGLGETPLDVDVPLNMTDTKKFKLNKGEDIEVQIDVEASYSLKKIVSLLDDKLSASYNARALLGYVNMSTEGTKLYPAVIIVRLDKNSGNTIDINSVSSTETLKTELVDEVETVTNCYDLFLTAAGAPSDKRSSGMATCNEASAYSLQVYDYETVSNGTAVTSGVTVEYNEDTDSIILKTTNTGSSETVKFVEAAYGDYLVSSVSTSNIALAGGDEIDLLLSRSSDSDYKIKVESDKAIDTPTIENITPSDIGVEQLPAFFKNLLSIMVDPNDPVSTGADDPVQGADAVEASARDMIVFTSKEKGSATNNIVVEVYTTVSPIANDDGTYTKTHYLTVTVDNVLKETYEDISLVYDDVDNRFDTIINESEDNGGSSYINVKVIKNNFADTDVELPDGVYKIGKANKSTDIKKTDDIEYTGYDFYDYTVGNDGVPTEDGGDLFEDAMAAGTSKLANKELYDFHVLITPDDITQQVQSAAIALCEDRGDAIAIIDPPVGLSKKAVIDWHNGKGNYGRSVAPTSNFAATYWPWCKVSDPTANNKICWVMPSVVMAAKYVTVDKTAGCWYAPAGETNGQLSVIDIEQYPSRLDRDDLYVDYNRINPLAKFKDGNIYAYGEKTLQRTNSVLTKIHTRRMLVQIKKQCREALKGYIFMPNTTSYLGKISSNMTAILETYKAGGGLSYYKVICDETNNPTEVRQQDIVNVDVILVPEGTIEQINISLTLNRSEETVSD